MSDPPSQASRQFGFPRPPAHGYTVDTIDDANTRLGRSAVKPNSRIAVMPG